jgi:hypothetical protein
VIKAISRHIERGLPLLVKRAKGRRIKNKECFVMLKEHDPPKEPARSRAERRWKNNEARRRIKEEKQRPLLVDPNKEPEIAETITNEEKPKGSINRLETKFKKEIRAMLQGHVDKNLAIYAVSLQKRKYLLLKEKLRRLQATQLEQGG